MNGTFVIDIAHDYCHYAQQSGTIIIATHDKYDDTDALMFVAPMSETSTNDDECNNINNEDYGCLWMD